VHACLLSLVALGAAPTAADDDVSLYKGLTITLHVESEAGTYRKQIDEIAGLGASAVSMIYPAYQHTGFSDVVFMRAWSPTLQTVGGLVDHARRRGLKVMLLPIVLVANATGEGDWRGAIEPPSWDDWFVAYRKHLARVAVMAQRHGVDILSVGSELSSSEHLTDHWVRTILTVRRHFKGKLLYSANWDHYEYVRFWPYLDYIGISTYFQLREHNRGQPTEKELLDAWAELHAELLPWRKKQGRPLVLTEVGYPSVDGCAWHPWDYDGSRVAGGEGRIAKIDQQEQAICFAAMVKAWSTVPEVAGVFVYSWQGAGGPDDRTYTVRGKPAEAILRRWFADPRAALGKP